jgi:Holliday junction resolvasome RuvABC ATP-dependent DNA helicase subunit
MEESVEEASNEMEIETTKVVPQTQTERKNFENLPWVEKYRPTTFNDLISHDNIIKTLDKLIASNKLPHLLFYGPPGTILFLSFVIFNSQELEKLQPF